MEGSEPALSPVKARWAMLKNAILNKKLHGNELLHSVRSFSSYELFSRKQCTLLNRPDDHFSKGDERLWFSYTCKDIIKSKPIWIQHPGIETNLKVKFMHLVSFKIALFWKNFFTKFMIHVLLLC